MYMTTDISAEGMMAVYEALEYAEEIGLGSRTYELIHIDE